jgi:glucose/arabinose dehydrogenase
VRPWRALAPAAIVAAALASPAAAQLQLPDGFADSTVVSGLSTPIGMAFLPDGRLLVTEQQGTLRLVVDTVRAGVHGARVDSVGVVPGVIGAGTEQGLLGVAVDPRWPARPYLYVHGTDSTAHVRVARYSLHGTLTGTGPLALDPASRYIVLDVPDQDPRHNGGTLRFGADHMLYASFGDDEQHCLAQDTASLHGVILRLDVTRLPDGPGGPAPTALIAAAGNPFASHPDSGARLVWAFGLRNPFRFHIDPLDGVLSVGDVGEATWEEVDRVAVGGHDFGWPMMEGPEAYTIAGVPWAPQNCDTVALGIHLPPGDPPVFAYRHTGFGGYARAVIDAGASRRPPGAQRPFPRAYEGDHFVADFYDGFIVRLREGAGAWRFAPPVPGQPNDTTWATGVLHASDFAIGPDGALWYCQLTDAVYHDHTGAIHRIVPPFDSTLVSGPEGSVALGAPVPSPARGAAAIAYHLPDGEHGTLRVFDLAGRRVRSVDVAGEGTWQCDGRDDRGRRLPGAVYVVRLEALGQRRERRLVLVR